MTVLSDFRTRVRQAQGLTSVSTERGFADSSLDAHVIEAVAQFSLYVPIRAQADVVVTGGLRTFALSSLTRPISVEACEYPTGNWPRSLVDFDVWNSTVTLDHSPPSSNYTVRVYYHQQHLVDGSGSTIEAEHETVIVEGAAALAMLSRAAGAANTMETATTQTLTLGHLRIAQQRYDQWLRLLKRLAGAFRQRRFYTAADRPISKNTVAWP